MAKRSPNDALQAYRAKRSADRTPEPFGHGEGAPGLYVFHQHAASHLHFDLRLELNGTLKSWAVPKGPSLDPKEKRFAVMVEDHPVEYGSFEGHIPKGNYGAGAVILWDRGRWEPVEDPVEGLEKGKLTFRLHGYKLRGEWALVRTKRNPKEWLLIKHRDEWAGENRPLSPQSVLSGLTVEQLRDRVDRSRDLKAQLEKLGAPKRRLTQRDTGFMLCQPRDEPFSDPAWIYELKYDGYRLLARRDEGKVRLLFRRGSDATPVFPDVAAALERLPFHDLVLDGEVVVLDETGQASFQLLQRRAQLRKGLDIKHASLKLPATFFAFDLLGLEGYDLRALSTVERKRLLEQVVPRAGPILYSDHIREHGLALWKEVEKRHLEGIVAKRADAPYRSGRSADWLKIALGHRADFVVVGFTEPEGSRVGIGALQLAVYEGDRLVLAGGVGTGFSDEELGKIRKLLEPDVVDEKPCEGEVVAGRKPTWVTPKHVVEVRYKQWTDDGNLRHPVFVRWRHDKEPRECVKPTGSREAPSVTAVEESAPVETKQQPPVATTTREVTLSNLNKVFWPEDGYTKGDLIEYYQGIAPWILPYLRDRPLMLTRYPDGIHGKSFFQKDAPSWTPSWVRRVKMWSEDRQDEVEQFVCDDEDTLVHLANMGTIPLHVWSARISSLQHPDWCILDLDPKTAPFTDVVKVALEVKKLCDEIELPTFVKTTGSSGLHVMIPLGLQLTHQQSQQLAELLARVVAQRNPEIATVARPIADRGGRVYVDFGQNGQGRLIAVTLCVRPVIGASVSMPLRWSEVTAKLHPSQFTIRNALDRMHKLGEDPFRPVLELAPDIPKALAKLAPLVQV